MKTKIIFSFLLALLVIVLILLFGNKLNENLKALSLKNNYTALENISKKEEEVSFKGAGDKIFSQIEKQVSLEKLVSAKETTNVEEKKEVIKKIEAAIEKSDQPEKKISQERALLEKFKKELAASPNKICAGHVKGTNTNDSSFQNCEGGADPSNCADEEGHYSEENLNEEGGWGYSTGGEDVTDCCQGASDTDVCGEGDITIPGKCEYSGDIFNDGLLTTAPCCDGCCVDCTEDCCSDCGGCCVSSCEYICKYCYGYNSYIWNSSTQDCGCAD